MPTPDILADSIIIKLNLHGPVDGPTLKRWIADRIREAMLEEREVCISAIQKYLLFDNQRAVSWHEVQDAIAAIRARNTP